MIIVKTERHVSPSTNATIPTDSTQLPNRQSLRVLGSAPGFEDNPGFKLLELSGCYAFRVWSDRVCRLRERERGGERERERERERSEIRDQGCGYDIFPPSCSCVKPQPLLGDPHSPLNYPTGTYAPNDITILTMVYYTIT